MEDVTGQAQLKLELDQVNPSQFLGIEINPRASAIADLVIWIGYLKWHFKRFGNIPPVEPVLREYKNIEGRDAVLAYDSKELDIDTATNQPRTRWGGRMIKHPVTGENVPDPSDQIPIYRYINPRPAEWLPPQPPLLRGDKERVYIVSNPPFIGNDRMREMLGDSYAETLRKVYKDVPDTVDYVMYWWHKAAELVRADKVKRFGLITTNSIRQPRLRTVIEFHLTQKKPLQLILAIPAHPWTDGGADVRIAMTGGELDDSRKVVRLAQLSIVVVEGIGETPEESADQIELQSRNVERIFADLKAIAVGCTEKLQANLQLSCPGMKMTGSGFLLTINQAVALGYDEATRQPKVIKKYIHGRDITDKSRGLYTIDLFGYAINQVQILYPKIYQWIYERVKLERDTNNRKALGDNWWIYGEARATLRPALKNLKRYIVTVETAKHRVFIFLDAEVVPDNKLVVIAFDDAYFLGVLSSTIHIKWSLATGGWLGVGNDPVYVKTRCFDPFPFPDSTPEQKQKIRDLGERLDNHRKRVQTQHPDVTITGMYNLLEKMRSGERFTDQDREYNDKALVSTLKQIHDQLDAAVFEAYGWPQNLSDDEILERLVTLNSDRAQEERNGFIRWLRPEYQAPKEVAVQQVIEGFTTEEDLQICLR